MMYAGWEFGVCQPWLKTCSQCLDSCSDCTRCPYDMRCQTAHNGAGVLPYWSYCVHCTRSDECQPCVVEEEVTCVSAGPAHTLFPCWYNTKNGAGSSLSHTPSTVGSAAARVMKSNGLKTMRRSILVISEGGRRVGLKSTPQKYSPYLCCAGPTYLNHACWM